MAKKQAKRPGPKPSGRTRDALLAIKGFPEWKAWVIRFAESRCMAPTQLVELALARLAAGEGFEPPPKR